MQQRIQNQKGFTLVELAIVLVIIGLIVGGVLVGQDMIKAAEIRSTVGQVEKFNAAVNTFRNKYNGLPGDVRNPANLGFANTGSTGVVGTANGNGVIESSGTDANGLTGETAIFWTHMSQANLIDGSTGGVTTYAPAGGIALIDDTHLPQAKMGKGNRFHVSGVAGINYFTMGVFTVAAAASSAITAADGLLPVEAFQIDSKLDDSQPTTGSVISILSGGAPQTLTVDGIADPIAGSCVDSDAAPVIYAMNDDQAKGDLGCQLRIRSTF